MRDNGVYQARAALGEHRCDVMLATVAQTSARQRASRLTRGSGSARLFPLSPAGSALVRIRPKLWESQEYRVICLAHTLSVLSEADSRANTTVKETGGVPCSLIQTTTNPFRRAVSTPTLFDEGWDEAVTQQRRLTPNGGSAGQR